MVVSTPECVATRKKPVATAPFVEWRQLGTKMKGSGPRIVFDRGTPTSQWRREHRLAGARGRMSASPTTLSTTRGKRPRLHGENRYRQDPQTCTHSIGPSCTSPCPGTSEPSMVHLTVSWQRSGQGGGFGDLLDQTFVVL